MSLEIDLLTFPLPGLAGVTARMFEDAGWDGLYLADTQSSAAEVYTSLGLAAAATAGLRHVRTRHRRGRRARPAVDLGLGSRDADPGDVATSMGLLAAEVVPRPG